MKTTLSFLVPFLMSILAQAQDYLGTYQTLPPLSTESKTPYSEIVKRIQLRVQILPTRVIYTFGSFKPAPSNITYSKEGHFILAEDDGGQSTMYFPIYLYDKNTIFTIGGELRRVDNNNNSSTNLGTYESVMPPSVLADPLLKADWYKSKLRVEILPAQVIYTEGTLRHGTCSIIPVREGTILIAKDDQSTFGVIFNPVYLFDKDTIFTMGEKMLREKDSKGIQEASK